MVSNWVITPTYTPFISIGCNPHTNHWSFTSWDILVSNYLRPPFFVVHFSKYGRNIVFFVLKKKKKTYLFRWGFGEKKANLIHSYPPGFMNYTCEVLGASTPPHFTRFGYQKSWCSIGISISRDSFSGGVFGFRGCKTPWCWLFPYTRKKWVLKLRPPSHVPGRFVDDKKIHIILKQPKTSWWFQPIWKILVKLESFPR